METVHEIALKFNGDTQLVRMWTSVLKHNHWMQVDRFDKVVVTEKGSAHLHRRDLDKMF